MNTMTAEEWQAMPEIVLPFMGKETGFTLTDVRSHCSGCGTALVNMRGEVYESFGVIEMKMFGLCPVCNHLVRVRSRVIPKTGIFMMERNGKWETQRMISQHQKRKERMLNLMMPPMMGMVCCMLATLAVARTTKWTWIGWGMVFAVIVVMAGVMSKPKRG